MPSYLTFFRVFKTSRIKNDLFNKFYFGLIPSIKNQPFYTKFSKKFLTTNTKESLNNVDVDLISENELSKIDLLQERIKVLESDINNYIHRIEESKEKLLRSLAENENLRQRHKKDLESLRLYSISNFAKSLLDVSDNLSKALSSIDIEKINQDPIKNFYNGVSMTHSTLNKVFEMYNIIKFESLGKQFNPKEHEAIYEVKDLSKPKGLICEELQPGYKINDRILRAAKVATIKN